MNVEIYQKHGMVLFQFNEVSQPAGKNQNIPALIEC